MTDRGEISTELKRLVESMAPDLRPYFRPSLDGVVTATNDEDYTVDVRIGPADGDHLALPEVPVASLFAQDGYGVWALPEEDAEVTVSFTDGDVTRPYVESPMYRENKAPSGFTTGTIAIRGKHGQKLEFKPDVNEAVVSAGSVKVISSEKRQDKTTGEQNETVVGDRTSTTEGSERVTAGRWSVVVDRDAVIEAGQLTEKTDGNLVLEVGGSLNQQVGGSVNRQVAGSVADSITFSKRQVIGGGYEILVAATPGIVASPAYSILVNCGDIAIDASTPGKIDIGASLVAPPAMINIGSAPSGPVQLGGTAAAGQAAACGVPLQAILNNILNVLQTVPLGIGNLGAPITPNPAVTTALSTAISQMATLLSTKVFIAQA